MKQSPDSQITNLEVEFQVPSFHFIKQLEKGSLFFNVERMLVTNLY